MKAGALGLATGLEYDPGIYSASEEVVELAKEAARHGGRYISHVRSEDRDFWAAIDEIVRIGREAKIPVEVTHMKLAMKDWWGQSERLLGVLDKARAEGIDVTADIYPYEFWHSDLTVLFPKRDFTNREDRAVRPRPRDAGGRHHPHGLQPGARAGRQVAGRDRGSQGHRSRRRADGPDRALAGQGRQPVDHGQGDGREGHRRAHRLAVREHLLGRLARQPASARARRVHESAARVRAREEDPDARGGGPQDDRPVGGEHGHRGSRRDPARRLRGPRAVRSGDRGRPLDVRGPDGAVDRHRRRSGSTASPSGRTARRPARIRARGIKRP